MEWFCWAFVGLFFALQPSYIHPDEHFQSLEVLGVKISGVNGSVPWEFTQNHAARSFVPLYLGYWLPFNLSHLLSPLAVLIFIRFQNYTLYFLVSRYALKNLTHSGDYAEILLASSYITWCYQSHSFSNSLETLLLLIALSLYTDMMKKKSGDQAMMKSAILAMVITLGFFNRITFPIFLFLPSIVLFLKFYVTSLKSLMVFIFTLSISTLFCIFVDTLIYDNRSGWVITPLNNLKYNLDESNLAKHGLHPRYTHILINFPQLIGPIFLFLRIPRKSLRGWFNDMPLLSVISGMMLLSIFKHQELRFLIPLTPLILMKLRFNSYWEKYGLKLWLGFNLIMAAILGILHQGGIIPLLDIIRKEPVDVHIWWKTYSPPTWMYANENLTVSTTNFAVDEEKVDAVPFSIVHDHIVDLKGCDEKLLDYTLDQFFLRNANIQLMAPRSVALRLELLQDKFEFQTLHSWPLHLDLDHIDSVNGILGIAQYNVTRK